MSSHNRQLIRGTDEHPTLEELRQYQEDTLPTAASQEVEQHISSCEICTDVVEGMTLADRASTRKAVHSINFKLHNLNQPKKKRRLPYMPLLDWRAAAAILALLCLLALFVYYHFSQLADTRPAAVTHTEKPAESHIIAGRVLGENGEGMPGVAVTVKGTSDGTITDMQGNFRITAPATKSTFEFNTTGHEPVEAIVDSHTASVKVNLFPGPSALSAVVVTGGNDTTPATAAPTPIGGTSAFNKYLKENLRYPEAAREANVQGKVAVAFTVTPEGQLSDVHVVDSLHPACDAEAIRLVKEGLAWQPAVANGEPVAQQVKIAIRFKP